LPTIIASIAAAGELRLKGTAPVNACDGQRGVMSQTLTEIIHPRCTSIITIAKEKTSASLLYVPTSFRISGAVHRAAWPP
jgi:hypothetical protein